MKKLGILTTTLLLSTNIFACDICGGGLGSNYLGLLPDFNRRFVGLRYHFNELNTQLDINGNKTALSNHEKYSTIDIWTAWNISNKWRLMAIVPYSNISKYNYGTDTKQSKNGLGDLTLSIYYNLLNSSITKSDRLIVQSLWLGIGGNFSTGAYNSNELLNNNSPNIYQLGSGSNDLITFANYDIRIQNLGINISTSYKINSQNKDEYRYGNKAILNTNLYYKVSLNEKIRITPNIGVNYEKQAKDQSFSYKMDETGGQSFNANIGLEANLRKIAIGFLTQQPIQQNISLGRTELKSKYSSHISYTF